MLLRKNSDEKLGQKVGQHVNTILAEYKANERDRRGLVNRPRYVAAKSALVSMGSPAVTGLVEKLLDCWASEQQIERDVANTIAEVIGEIGDPKAIDPLLELLGEPIPELAYALAAIQHPDAVRGLIAALADPTKTTSAIVGLTHTVLCRDEVVSLVITELRTNASINVRFEAAYALEILGVGRSAAIEALRDALDDESQSVSNRADRSLRELGFR